MQKLQTIIFPTTRAIRHELLTLENTTQFLPSYINVSEFLERVCIVEGFKKIDNDTRTVLLLEAADFKEFDKLQIEKNFFTFTQNSSYIFALFTELSGEKKSFDKLQTADTYGDYEEHLSILKILYEKYESLCIERKMYDPILLPKLYKFNESYVKSLGEITLVVEGYLSAFEMEIVEDISKIVQLNLLIRTTAFNKKMRDKFQEYEIELGVRKEYLIDFTCKKIIDEKMLPSLQKIECVGLSEQILQVAFIKQKVYEFIREGMECEDIAIILPNESFARMLREQDREGNFNFAMGKEFRLCETYTRLEATCEYIENTSVQNAARLKRLDSILYEKIYPVYNTSMKEVDFEAIMMSYQDTLHVKSEIEIFKEELHIFLKLKPLYEELTLKGTLHLFMQRLSKRAIDDVRGGKITVMGVLESRHVNYKGVIIVDFNDSNVPKKSEKDLFLNSDIRLLAGLPTQHDRENLQKHYYWLLINTAQKVAISYVKSTASIPSRFLTELQIKSQNSSYEQEYAQILYTKHEQIKERKEDQILKEYDFSKVKLSATSLKTYLDCKRKYYNRYILNIKNHEMPQDFPSEHKIGQDIHEALKIVYAQESVFLDRKKLQKRIETELEKISGNSTLEEYQLKLWSKKLNSFVENEIERFHQGYEVLECEKTLTCKFFGMELTGQIDRLDVRDGKLYVLDYKSGKYPLFTKKTVENATDFQLEFYYLLASTLGQVEECGYYDLNEGKIVAEELLEEKIELLQKHIEEMLLQKVIDFRMTEDSSKCQYCEFSIMCGKSNV